MKKIPLSLFTLLFIGVLSSCSSMKNFAPKADIAEKAKLSPAWIKNLDPIYDSGNLPIALQSPLINEGIVYAGHNTGYMQAYELENGRVIWSEFDGSAYHAGAIAYKDHVIYGTVQGRVISRHAILGTVKYSVDLGARLRQKVLSTMGEFSFNLETIRFFVWMLRQEKLSGDISAQCLI